MSGPFDPEDLDPAEAQVPELDEKVRRALGHELDTEDDGTAALAASGEFVGADLDDPEFTEATADLDDQDDLLAGPTAMTLGGVEEILNLRWPETMIEPSLDRIVRLLEMVDNPERVYPVIQVAGTNGKTSTARMIDALLSRIGLRTGRFTSPHLQKVTERISIDSVPIDDRTYVDTYLELAPFIDLVDSASAADDGVDLSKFEILTAMAYAAFAYAPVEVAVVEVGMGGRWDSTNAVDAQVAVITPVGMDHTEYLGDDLESIAGEKAGIIKAGSTVVIGAQEPAAMEVILRQAVAHDASVARFDSEFSVIARDVAVGGQKLTIQGLGGVYPEIFLPLHGEHQAQNAAVALAAVEVFFGAGPGRQLDLTAVQDGFAAVASPGRLERVRTDPTVLIDAAHNPHGANALVVALADEFSFTKLICVFAAMADKDVRGMLEVLGDAFDDFVITTNSSPRSMPLEEIADLAREILGEEKVHTAEHMEGAIALAVDLAEESAIETGGGAGIVVTGSVVSAGDARNLAGRNPQ
ncbi:bifunctional folylpolyglutamate synthase/dihydrofolate synthase [Nakamurella silvestris]|nr:bifunctional folylpolyglutamate synthase/dihydrofolate synthase [Nakamurella silvestris]